MVPSLQFAASSNLVGHPRSSFTSSSFSTISFSLCIVQWRRLHSRSLINLPVIRIPQLLSFSVSSTTHVYLHSVWMHTGGVRRKIFGQIGVEAENVRWMVVVPAMVWQSWSKVWSRRRTKVSYCRLVPLSTQFFLSCLLGPLSPTSLRQCLTLSLILFSTPPRPRCRIHRSTSS